MLDNNHKSACGLEGEAPIDAVEASRRSIIDVSVVLPCLNEEATVGTCVRKARTGLERAGVRGEVIVADNGSTDSSREIAEAAGARVVPCEVRGYGAAIRAGVAAARGEIVIMADSDDSYDLLDLAKFIEPLQQGEDMVVGNRFAGGIEQGAMPWKNRYIGNPVLSALVRILFSTQVRDSHCGLRSFTRSAYRRMAPRTTGMEFASELVIRASQERLRVIEVPTTLRPDGRDHAPHLRPWADGWRHLKLIFRNIPRGRLAVLVVLMLGILGIVGGLALGGAQERGATEAAAALGLLMPIRAIAWRPVERARRFAESASRHVSQGAISASATGPECRARESGPIRP